MRVTFRRLALVLCAATAALAALSMSSPDAAASTWITDLAPLF
jgi:hypothetical protein